MNATVKIDAARVELLLSELRLPGIKLIWAALAETADKEGWPAARFLAALAEQEMVERCRRRFERHLEEARLPPGKTLDAFDFDAVPMVSKAQVQALAAGDAWLEKGANLLCFGPPGGGKSHLAAALGMALIERAGACCSPEPPTSCKNFRSRAAISCSKRRSPNSTNIICSSSTILPMSPRIKPRPAFCSS
jgi:DNA replication protein DnaC